MSPEYVNTIFAGRKIMAKYDGQFLHSYEL